ncbi:cellulose synthase operon protein YhjQ/BcsQ [Terriglobus saanensis]|uniref:Cellulose synthase operon protein YhjQ n=1 Tax=Terriglobus saanensis (strain ATCC BAA-1853 / DSM 23119 / SP1PR4) TaxID=401053 RepID=E8V0S5_TERSS|nr:cellulose synthase operon protein YhjQ/BcsQ [Terriglobus saanensis]ADV82216.1 cellulose synthase operon protein YhjQ [Terriglobus saanensis SP1PR4]
MEVNENPMEDEQEIRDTPEDVAILYSWANLHGAKYRDFSASRREYRAKMRQRALEAQRIAELKAAQEREEAAQLEEKVANHRVNETSGETVSAVEAEEAATRAEMQRQEAQRHAHAAALAEMAAQEAEREVAEARKRAVEQAARYEEAGPRMRASADLQTPAVPGEVQDPYYYAGHPDPGTFASTPGVRTAQGRVSPEPKPYIAVPQYAAAEPSREQSRLIQDSLEEQGHQAEGDVPRGFEGERGALDRQYRDRQDRTWNQVEGRQITDERLRESVEIARRLIPPPVYEDSALRPIAREYPQADEGYVAPRRAPQEIESTESNERRRQDVPSSPIYSENIGAQPRSAFEYEPTNRNAEAEVSPRPAAPKVERRRSQERYRGSEERRRRILAQEALRQREARLGRDLAEADELKKLERVEQEMRAQAELRARFEDRHGGVPTPSLADAERILKEQEERRAFEAFGRESSAASGAAGPKGQGSDRVRTDSGHGVRQSTTRPPGLSTRPPSGLQARALQGMDTNRPAWLVGEPDARTAGPRQAEAMNDTLQHSRERVAARWYALKGLMGQPLGEPEPVKPVLPQAELQMPILAVMSLAGGVGKTSLVATLGRMLSAMGEKVLLADMASVGLLPYYFGARELRPGVMRTFSPPAGSTDAPVYMVSLETDQVSADVAGQERLLQDLRRASRGVQRVLLDLSGASMWMARSLASVSPTILVPVAPDMNSVLGIQGMEKTLQSLVNADGRPISVFYVLTQFDATLPLHLDIREALKQKLGARLLPISIRRSPSVSEALAEGMTVIDYAPSAHVTEDYTQLASWVRNQTAPATAGFRGMRWSEG